MIRIAALCILGMALTGCEMKYTQNEETKDFTFITTGASDDSTTDVAALNQWLKLNPYKKVVTFSSIPKNAGGSFGYLLQYLPESSANQFFNLISHAEVSATNTTNTVTALACLQKWKDEHAAQRIIAFATVGGTQGEVREILVCSEAQ